MTTLVAGTSSDARRNGVALVTVLVVLAVVTLLFTVLTVRVLADRRVVDRRGQQLQAEWLARAGIELALERLPSQGQTYTETVTLLPNSNLQIDVKPGGQERVLIRAEAAYPTDLPSAVHRLLTRQAKQEKPSERRPKPPQ